MSEQKIVPYYLYRDGVSVAREGLCKVEGALRQPMAFEGEPVLPIIAGEVWHSGWDIPTRYAIDADNQCWMDNAHGHPSNKVSAKDFLNLFNEEKYLSLRIKYAERLGVDAKVDKCPTCGHMTRKY